MSEIDLKFESLYKTAVVSMRINGSYPPAVRNKFWYMQAFFVITINALCFYLLSYSTLFHDIRSGNFTEACKNIAMIIVSVNTTLKYVALLYYRESIWGLIKIVDEDYKLAKTFSLEEQNIMKRYAKESRFVCLFWIFCTISGSGIFPLKAIVLTIRSFRIGENEYTPMFDLTFNGVLEQHKNSPTVYYGFFALCLVFAFLSSMMYVGYDPLIPIFTLHTCGQLDILSLRLSNALSAVSLREKENNIKQIVIKLQQLYSFIDRVKIDFTLLNEFNMKATTIFVPLLIFNIVEDLRNYNSLNFEFIILAIGAIIQFLMPCYFSDQLMERSDAFRAAIYSCGWEKQPDTNIRKTVLIMITRTIRPLGISSVFYVISLDAFASMSQQAYALFNLMNAAWRE